MKKKSIIPKIFYSKVFLVLALILLGVIGYSEYGRWSQRTEVDREIALLKSEEQELVLQNQQLEESIEYLSSAEYQKKLARLQLNLQKPGEIVVNFPPEPKVEQASKEQVSKSNLIKWWEFIFIN